MTSPSSLPGIQPAVFAFPCATLITMMLAFIMYMTLRNAAHQKDVAEVGAQEGAVWPSGLGDEEGNGVWRGHADQARGLGGVWIPAQGPGAGGDVPKGHPQTRQNC